MLPEKCIFSLVSGRALEMAVNQSTTLAQSEMSQLSGGLPWNCIQTFRMPRAWIILTLLTLTVLQQHQLSVYRCGFDKYQLLSNVVQTDRLGTHVGTNMNISQRIILGWHLWFQIKYCVSLLAHTPYIFIFILVFQWLFVHHGKRRSTPGRMSIATQQGVSLMSEFLLHAWTRLISCCSPFTSTILLN